MDNKERVIKYNNEDITILWKPDTCIHAAECVKRLPEVYKPTEKPWVSIENASTEALKEQLNACPSGALSYIDKKPEFEVKQKDDGVKGEFYVEIDGKQEAKMTYVYVIGSNKIIIDHTEVSDKLKGKKIGFKLVEASVKFMREKDLKVIPLCPFAKSVFDKTSGFSDRLS